ncbi:transposase [Streptomyces griseus]|uniref:transposase n=1 Tax=Streptomyces griseus TaxID=1911 RepID=UPI00131AE3D8
MPESFLWAWGGRCGGWRDHRRVIDGVPHRVRTGVQWRDLPERFGPWKTVHERHRPGPADGTRERLLPQVRAAAGAAGETDWGIPVDSAIVRVHEHAVGARTDLPPVPGQKGSQHGTSERGAAAESGRPPGGGGAGGEGLGRSRGGVTSKLHLSAAGRCPPCPWSRAASTVWSSGGVSPPATRRPRPCAGGR